MVNYVKASEGKKLWCNYSNSTKIKEDSSYYPVYRGVFDKVESTNILQS